MLPKFTTLRLESQPATQDTMFDIERAGGDAGSHLRYAFLALLAANVFVISGALCFALLYFFHQ